MPIENNFGFIRFRSETQSEREVMVNTARADHDTLMMASIDCPEHIKKHMEEHGVTIQELQDRAFSKWISSQERMDRGGTIREIEIGGVRITSRRNGEIMCIPGFLKI